MSNIRVDAPAPPPSLPGGAECFSAACHRPTRRRTVARWPSTGSPPGPAGSTSSPSSTTRCPPRGAGEVTIEVRAAGINPADAKHVARGDDRRDFPRRSATRSPGVLTRRRARTPRSPRAAVPSATRCWPSGSAAAGPTSLTVPAADVFAKPARAGLPARPPTCCWPARTAAEMLHVTGVRRGRHRPGARRLRRGRRQRAPAGRAARRPGDRHRERGAASTSCAGSAASRSPTATGSSSGSATLAPDGVVAALDCVGTDEAVDVSLALVADRDRIVTIAAPGRAEATGSSAIGGAMPASAAFRDGVRAHLIDLAATGGSWCRWRAPSRSPTPSTRGRAAAGAAPRRQARAGAVARGGVQERLVRGPR